MSIERRIDLRAHSAVRDILFASCTLRPSAVVAAVCCGVLDMAPMTGARYALDDDLALFTRRLETADLDDEAAASLANTGVCAFIAAMLVRFVFVAAV